MNKNTIIPEEEKKNRILDGSSLQPKALNREEWLSKFPGRAMAQDDPNKIFPQENNIYWGMDIMEKEYLKALKVGAITPKQAILRPKYDQQEREYMEDLLERYSHPEELTPEETINQNRFELYNRALSNRQEPLFDFSHKIDNQDTEDIDIERPGYWDNSIDDKIYGELDTDGYAHNYSNPYPENNSPLNQRETNDYRLNFLNNTITEDGKNTSDDGIGNQIGQYIQGLRAQRENLIQYPAIQTEQSDINRPFATIVPEISEDEEYANGNKVTYNQMIKSKSNTDYGIRIGQRQASQPIIGTPQSHPYVYPPQEEEENIHRNYFATAPINTNLADNWNYWAGRNTGYNNKTVPSDNRQGIGSGYGTTIMDNDPYSFNGLIPKVFNLEGGFSNRINDRGGPTNHGIAWNTWLGTAKPYLGKEPTLDNLKSLTQDEARQIYHGAVWKPSRAEEIMDGKTRHLYFDFVVNSGQGNAVRNLQQAVNQTGGNVKVDGGIGPKTLNGVNTHPQKESLYQQYKQNRIDHYNRIIEREPEQMENYNGWMNRMKEF